MEFEWDEAKSTGNFEQRGIDFRLAASVFAGPVCVRLDVRRDYGEVRAIAIGKADGVTLTVVFTDQVRANGTPARRIISARTSNQEERIDYAEAQKVREHGDSWPRRSGIPPDGDR